MLNTMECKRDSFSGAPGGVRETHWEYVSHALKESHHLAWILNNFFAIFGIERFTQLPAERDVEISKIEWITDQPSSNFLIAN